MVSDCHVVQLMTNFYITFSPTEMSEFQFTLSKNDILDHLNENKAIEVKYNASTVKEFTIFLSSLLKHHFKISDPHERLQICAINDIVVDPMIL